MTPHAFGRAPRGPAARGFARRVAVWGALALAAATAAAQEDADCLVCHEDAGMFEGLDDAARLVVSPEGWAGSIHAEMGITCVDCHQELDGVEPPHEPQLASVDCGACHDVQETFDRSLHGYALQRGDLQAPDCARCHGVHDIRPAADPAAPTHHLRVAELCASCHGVAGLRTPELVRLPRSSGYAESVHGVRLAQGVIEAATCVDCHGVHDVLGPGDPNSRIHAMRVAETCGQCHEQAAAQYGRSIHGLARQAGILDSPTCTDCHGEHLLRSPDDPDAQTHMSRLAAETCGKCHDDPGITARYGLAGGVVGSYVDSYHAWAVRGEHERAATCVSCHTAHDVLPKDHPASTVHADRVVTTCQQCHPRADERFAASYTHAAASITANPINRFLRAFYVVMIVAVIGGMALHNLLILAYYARRRREFDRAATVRRFDGLQVVQHGALALSFIALAVTGFALRYPEAWWVRYLAVLGMDEPVRATLHRVCAVVLVVCSVLHVAYVFLNRRGRDEIRAMLPVAGDLADLRQNLRFHLRRSKEPVRFGRYDYTQKAEYWALVWGTALMAVTGLILWFPAFAVRLLPSWTVPASQTVHFYEAWLATLAILVWHLFFVMFHPEQYPMSWTWLSGKISEDEARHHHGRWWDEELAAQHEAPLAPERAARQDARREGEDGSAA